MKLFLFVKFIENLVNKLTIFNFQQINFIDFENCIQLEIY